VLNTLSAWGQWWPQNKQSVWLLRYCYCYLWRRCTTTAALLASRAYTRLASPAAWRAVRLQRSQRVKRTLPDADVDGQGRSYTRLPRSRHTRRLCSVCPRHRWLWWLYRDQWALAWTARTIWRRLRDRGILCRWCSCCTRSPRRWECLSCWTPWRGPHSHTWRQRNSYNTEAPASRWEPLARQKERGASIPPSWLLVGVSEFCGLQRKVVQWLS